MLQHVTVQDKEVRHKFFCDLKLTNILQQNYLQW
jgi:hypothetical protein